VGLRNTPTEWGSLSRALHWIVAIGIVTLLWIGLYQSGMERGLEKTELRMIHGSIAIVLGALMVLRLAWRWMNETPGQPAGNPPWQNLASKLVHWGLYIAVFVQLISGAMVVATNGNGLPFFGLFRIPVPIAENHDAHEFWEEIHEPGWWAIVILFGVHLLGVLFNHIVRKNDVLKRMVS
jgi:cytochrome b561